MTLSTVHTPPRDKLYKPYIFNAPAPAVLQPAMDFDRAPEDKLFARLASSGEETGWIGMVGATSSASFPANGELMSLFFRSYGSPHDSVLGRNRLGDMWRSMIEYWLTEDVFDAAGNFDFDAIFAKYSVSEGSLNDYCSGFGMQHTMMESLFGDPSLRAGGLAAEGDAGAALYHSKRCRGLVSCAPYRRVFCDRCRRRAFEHSTRPSTAWMAAIGSAATTR